jgi:hypothetical protein
MESKINISSILICLCWAYLFIDSDRGYSLLNTVTKENDGNPTFIIGDYIG